MHSSFRSLLVACLIALAGCGSRDWGTATGTVVCDGQVLTSGVVVFHPIDEGPVATSLVSSNGTFKAMTGATEGLKIGEYKVTVVDQTTPKMGSDETAKLLTPEKYASPTTTDLLVTIKAGHNPLTLVLQK